MNILSLIKDQLSPDIVGQIGRSVGESPQGTKSVLEQSLPALLGSAASTASSPKGATDLFNLLTQKAPQGGWPESISGLLGGGGGVGTSFVNTLLGSKMGMIRDFIASRSGVRGESASSLMGIGGSILMSILGRQVASHGLGASGLGELLRSQIPHVQGLISPDLTKMLGIGNLFGTPKPVSAPSPAQTSYEPALADAGPPVRSGTGLRWALIPLALLLAGLFFMLRHNREEKDVGGTVDHSYTFQNTGGLTTVQAPAMNLAGFTDKLKAAMTQADGSPVSLQGVSFDSMGNLSPEAKSKLSAIRSLIADNPSLSVSITAYGKSLEESTSRANAIKSALAGTGLASDKVSVQPEVGEGIPKIAFSK